VQGVAQKSRPRGGEPHAGLVFGSYVGKRVVGLCKVANWGGVVVDGLGDPATLIRNWERACAEGLVCNQV
jgi:hypothetical protein